MIDSRIDFNVQDLSGTDIKALLGRLAPILSATEPATWRVDASRCRYLGPTAVVVLASAWLCTKQHGGTSEFIFPTEPPELVAFCRYSGLARLVDESITTESRHPNSETAALQRFDRANWGGSTPLVDLVQRHAPDVDDDTIDLLRLCYSEIAQNIEDHARSPIGGLACGRFFRSTQELRIAVADRGLGIAQTLRQAGHEVSEDFRALELVLKGNVSSKRRSNNMGQGISNLAAIAAGNRGRLLIASHEAIAEVTSKRPSGRISRLHHGFPGTLVSLSLPIGAGNTHPSP
ncbi:MAG: hypothetical protein HZB39_08425 [Planctomycetes bacterium]|nr:hypothetical protein [Planctomycetota bacterium]